MNEIPTHKIPVNLDFFSFSPFFLSFITIGAAVNHMQTGFQVDILNSVPVALFAANDMHGDLKMLILVFTQKQS